MASAVTSHAKTRAIAPATADVAPAAADAESWNRRGIEMGQAGRFDEAIGCFRRALELAPHLAAAHNNLGIAHARLRQFDLAVASFRQALRLDRASAMAHNNLASVLAEQGRHEEAIAHFEGALRLDDAYPDARFNLGKMLRQIGRFEEAATHFQQALALDPTLAKGHRNLGVALAAQGKKDEAVGSFRRAIELEPDDAEAHYLLGCALKDAEQFEGAQSSLSRAVELRPDYVEALNASGICLIHQARQEQAIGCFERAAALQPEAATTYSNWGIALAGLGRYAEAIARYQRALEICPEYAEVYNNLGSSQAGLHRYDEAVASYERSIALKPNYAEPHRNRSLIHLLRGEFDKGWPEFEWRWRCKDFDERVFAQPAWDGEPLDGKTILLHAEQGLGDTFQFIRYAALVKRRGATVVVRAPKQLLPLLRFCPYLDRLVTDSDDFQEFDVHLPLLSLPRIFETTLETVPNEVPYVFADPALITRWRVELDALDGLRVGISWQGNRRYQGDPQRSIPLRYYAPLSRIRRVRLINLQKGPGAEQLLEVADTFLVSEPVGSVDSESGPFMDTAAIVKNLDLVITSDTALAHLAGALGVKVWVALPYACDWRWLLDRDDSPWYPTMRLFRQSTPGDWEDVFRRLRAALAEEVKMPFRATRGRCSASRKSTIAMNVDAMNERGVDLAEGGQLPEALAEFDRAIWLRPRFVPAHYNRGTALHRRGQFAEAAASFRRALYLQPRYADARANLGVSLASMGQFDLAEQELAEALRLAPQAVATHYSLGNVSASQGKWHEAAAAFRRATQLHPQFAAGDFGLANVLRETSDFDGALNHYDRALRLRPDWPEARQERAATLLLLGDFDHGWAEYAMARQAGGAAGRSATLHESERLAREKQVLFEAGPDLAETLRLIGFAGRAKTHGAEIVLRCPKEHRELLEACPSFARVLGDEPPALPSERGIPLRWLPVIFPPVISSSTGAAPVAAPCASFHPSAIERWRREFDVCDGLKVGLFLQPERRHGQIENEWIESLGEIPGVRVFFLPRDDGRPGPQALAGKSGALPRVDNRPLPLDEMAAILLNLDLIIATDGIWAHLAGALGARVWVVLPRVPHWFWRLDGGDSDCYPTAKLFRQSRQGQWDDVGHAVLTELRRLLSGRLDVGPHAAAAEQLSTQGVALAERGHLDEAVALFQKAIVLAPLFADAYNNLGSAYSRLGRHDQAAAQYRLAIRRNALYPEAYSNLGIALSNLGEHEDASRAFRQAVKQRPDWALAHLYWGNSLASLDRWPEALARFQEAARLDPADENIQLNLAIAQRETNRLDESAATLERLLDNNPNHVDALNNLAVTYCRREMFERALECLGQAVRRNPDFAAAYNNLGITLAHLRRYEEAIDAYRRALAIQPDHAEAYSNLGISLTLEGRHEEALASFGKALSLRPNYPEALNNQGIALKEIGRPLEALAGYEQALALKPDYADAHLNRAFARLQRGEFEPGWQEYEWRWKHKPGRRRRFAQPEWDGSPLEGKSILLDCEQGLGDTLQFIRYATLVYQRGGRVVVRCPRALAKLLGRTSGIDQLVTDQDDLPAFDYHVALMSLPRVLRTTLDTVPNQVPYLFADPMLIEHWAAVTDAIRGIKVGINWQGNSRYQGDRNRSLPVASMAPLADAPDVCLISLQKGPGREQLAQLDGRFRVRDLVGADFDEANGAFMDTAALMMGLDVIVTSDTAIAHLAGALGRPVWVALPYSADWRWLADRNDSPWYPTMRLYRQTARGDWRDVFGRMRDDLTRMGPRYDGGNKVGSKPS